MSIIQSGVVNTHIVEGVDTTNKFPINKQQHQKNPFIFSDPLDDPAKKVLLNMFQYDHLIRSGLELNAWTTIDYSHKYQLYPVTANEDEYNTDEDITKAISKKTDLKKDDQERLLEYIRVVTHITDFEEWVHNYWLDAEVGGRSAFFVETLSKDKKNYMKDFDLYKDTPIMFKPLHWSHLEQTYIDTDTFRIKEVRYNDPNFTINLDARNERQDYLDLDNLIYLTCDDANMKEDSFGYGNSRLIPIIHLSAARRQITDKDAPEIFTSFWNQSGVLEVDDTSDSNIQYITKNLYTPGSVAIVRSQGAKFTPVQLKHDGWFMIQYLGLSRQEVLRMIRVPDFLLNYTADSRSVIETAINIWSKFVIEPDRQQIFRQLNHQFFNKLIKIFLRNNGFDENNANAILVRPVYKKISIEDLLSKANSLELLIRRDVITKRESRTLIDLPEKRMEDKEEDMKLSPLQWAGLTEQEKLILIQTAAKKELLRNTPQPGRGAFAAGGGNGNANEEQLTEEQQKDKNQTDAQKNPGVKTPKDRANSKKLSSKGAGRGQAVG